MKPPLAYYGAKVTIGPQIAALLPAHEHYVEPYAGSLAVLLAKRPSRMETVNDLDGDLMTFWRVLRDRPAELELAAALNDCAAAVVLSGYASDLYLDAYAGWHRHEIRTATGQANQWSARTEVLWSNRPLPVAEHLFETGAIA